MPGALRNTRNDAGHWREQYKGHLLHQLECAGGTKWLDTGNQKVPRATHVTLCRENHLCGPLLLDAPM